MHLSAGERLGHYEIVAPLGRGGMGAVYQAKDSRLHRMVAIKVLPEEFTGDPERLARFELEARVLAALNHPNIAAIYEVGIGSTATGEDAPPRPSMSYLVMELAPGETLDARIARGPIPVDEALPIALLIAEALEVAHERGIVHRDLKPANIVVDDEGRVKVLDFGLARIAEAEDVGQDVSHSPTLMRAATHAGVILGTAAYMSPEQARGKRVDSRADIWAFGVVLWEMLTGSRLFDGETVSDTLAAVLTRPLDPGELPAETPSSVRLLLHRCLQRNVRDRLQSIGDARLELQDGDSLRAAAGPQPSPARPAVRARLPWLIAAIAIIALAALSLVAFRRQQPSVPTLELSLEPPAGGAFRIGSNRGWGVISPDGQKIVFYATGREGSGLWVRRLSSADAKLLPDTTEGFYPFWAPDSQRLGFFSQNGLRRIDIRGGLPERIADASFGRGGSWTDDDLILFTPIGGGTVYRVAAAGGAATPLTRLDPSKGDTAHYWPVALPGGKFLYFIRSTAADHQGIYVGDIDSPAEANRRRLIPSTGGCLFVPARGNLPAHLLWVEKETLVARPFDPGTASFTGERVDVARGVATEESQRAPMISASNEGTLVYVPISRGSARLVSRDRRGATIGSFDLDTPNAYQIALSPDESEAAYCAPRAGSADIWIINLATGATRPLTSSPSYDEQPAWSPDGRRIAFELGNEGIAHIDVSGSSAPTLLPYAQLFPGIDESRIDFAVERWFGEFLLGQAAPEGKAKGLWAVPLRGGKAIPLSGGMGNHRSTVVAPSGRWILYISDFSGDWQPYVSSLRLTDGKPQAGDDRQRLPVARANIATWRGDGREIIVLSGDGSFLSIPVEESADSIRFGTPRLLFQDPRVAPDEGFAVTRDGERLFHADSPPKASRDMRVITNWTSRVAMRN
jgi:eukaryotic-like serine/threonine-protein kinase